ncbi:hypothetical protein F2Q69_00024471 [Brassica cretica]|uniref:RRM domain-containing protein n=1 Tax=Brassica cretica TaxID=69181 RepID=A0A8S9Q275_BRACR|nr:hypothetical protein F2Q69_00024471 [Brassica cretica]
MEDSRAFPLDPRAQEFVPLNPISSRFYFPYTSPPPPPFPTPPPSSYGLSPTVPRVFTFFNLPPHPMMFSPPPPPLPPPPRPYFNGVSAVQRLPFQSKSPTRSLSLISVPRDATESTVRRDLEVFGDVRGVQMERISEGIVTVHFYDLRDAKRAVREICGRHMQHQAKVGGSGSVWSLPSSSSPVRGFVSGRPVWAQFVVQATSAVPNGCNQGTLVVFNLNPEVSSIALRQIFQVYGPIKELRETPYKKHQRFVEFYDVRDAAKALDGMNGEEICGKEVVIEYSRPGGIKNKFRSLRQPHVLFQPPPILAPPMRQPLTLMKDKNKNVSPNNGVSVVEASMGSLCIKDNEHNKIRGAESETKSKNVANNKCNVGYGFVNMTSPEAAWRLYKAFHLQRWEVFNSQKICQITYARVQGLEDLKEHFKSAKFPCEAELYLPVVFTPPRDGKQLTEPVSININGCTGLDSKHLEPMDGQDLSVSGSCCGSDHYNSQEDDFSSSSIDGGQGLTVVGETSF